MDSAKVKNIILSGQAVVGIELGSTRIKTVLISPDASPIAAGGYNWENSYADGVWTYDLDDVWEGLQSSYRDMAGDVMEKYGVKLQKIAALGISGMMHGYLVFDRQGELLTPFRTWRNNITGQASEELSSLFGYPIPQRWSIAHLYQAALNNEDHLEQIGYMTTLAGYIHWKLTGKRVIGIGEASGMFPVDSRAMTFNKTFIDQFDRQMAGRKLGWQLGDILPEVLLAGKGAGNLTGAGAILLDPTGGLEAGVPMCPPEGDAGTGMVATNSVAKRSGNVSAGTSVFAMVVLEKPLKGVYSEVDLVTTPDGAPVALVHSNNCSSDLDAWIGLFAQAADLWDFKIAKHEIYDSLLSEALNGDPDGGGLLSYGYIAGEHITGFEQGRPLFARQPDSHFTLANFMRVHLMTAIGALKTGLDILFDQEGVRIDAMTGHGGFFKTAMPGQTTMAAAVGAPVTVMKTAGEGGAWGIALLARYMADNKPDESLETYLVKHVFNDMESSTIDPDSADVAGFERFMKRYAQGLAIEQAAVDHLND